jgi:hypothetical protein
METRNWLRLRHAAATMRQDCPRQKAKRRRLASQSPALSDI